MSDEDDDYNEDRGHVSLTGFLFGNMDTKTGQLEEGSIFGLESNEQLKGLESLGLGFSSILGDEPDSSSFQMSSTKGGKRSKKKKRKDRFSYNDDNDDTVDSSESSSDSENEEEAVTKNSQAQEISISQDEYLDNKKSPSAVDYSDFDECIEEEKENTKEYDDDYDTPSDLDKKIMPPPLSTHVLSTSKISAPQLSSLPRQEQTATSQNMSETKLDTPLASMLPSKYAGVSVTSLFPDFRANQVLRFSRLFGRGRLSNAAHIWRVVKKRRRKREKGLEEVKGGEGALKVGEEVVETPPELSESDLLIQAASTATIPSALLKKDISPYARNFDPDNPPLQMCLRDDEEVFLSSNDSVAKKDEIGKTDEISNSKKAVMFSLWRHGPASIWFEMLGIPEEPENFDYGFKLKSKEKEEDETFSDSDDEKNKESKSEEPKEVYPSDCFNMITQLDWESSIIWDSQDVKLKKPSANNAAGWVPSSSNRFAQSSIGKASDLLMAQNAANKSATSHFSAPSTSTSPASKFAKGGKAAAASDGKPQQDETFYSIFPVETEELVKGYWEKDIIWDAENVDEIPQPKVLELDPNDENIILCIPEDIGPNDNQNTTAPVKVKIPHPHVKKSKILLGKAGVINVIEEDSSPPSPKAGDKDPYNLSLDEYYQGKNSEQSMIKISTSGNIQHSTPVVELRAPFVPTHLGIVKLRNFHRPALRKFSNGPLALSGPHMILPLAKHIQKKAKQREDEKLAAGGGDIFFMRTPEDFTGMDGELILIEYSEEHPPLLSLVGMCSKIKNYYKRMVGKDDGPGALKYGENVLAHTSPFLGVMHPGQMIQTIENNMYRAAIFKHINRLTDFLVIRTRNNFYIRTFDAIFTAAQECPIYEVPGPNSKRANNFIRDFLQVFIYRLFWSSRDTPRRIRMEDIKKAFPLHSESSIRKRLKLCADFKRTGADSNWWVIKPEFRLPTEEEIRAMVSPEQCCAYFSLIAAEQRLKDAGYGTQSILAPLPEDEDENDEKKLDDEVKVAPWNTTRAYIQAIKGKCILQLNGPADPTGCGEGFSYVRMPNKPHTTIEEKETQPKRIVHGTDADLRKLSLNNAKALLRKFDVPEEEIQKLSRWEVIDVVRTLSTEKAKAGEQGMTKFSRGNRFSVAEHQERYKEDCQRIFEIQNRVLQSAEVLSTDEGESTDEEEEDNEDIEEMGKNIESMLSNKKTTSQLNHEKEEEERKELQRMIMGEVIEKDEEKNPKKKKKEEEDSKKLHGLSMHPGRVLEIHRKYRTPDGKEFTRNEIVRKSYVIDIYLRIRMTKDEAFIRQFALLDDEKKEQMKKEKRRIQEQLRRIKRNQDKEVTRKPRPVKPKKPPKIPKALKDVKVKCGMCGLVGHMKTNKACPYYDASNDPVPSVTVAMTQEEQSAIERQLISEDNADLVKVDGTKVQLSSKLIRHADELKRRSLVLKVPKQLAGLKYRRKRSMNNPDSPGIDYLDGKAKGSNRRRIDPQVVLCNILETTLNAIRNEPDSSHFHFPVDSKLPKYYEIISNPMDISKMREKIKDKLYQTGEEFLRDVKLMWDNSTQYNGENHLVTGYARKLYDFAEGKLNEQSNEISRLEKEINPLLDENDQKRFSYILKTIIDDKVKVMPEATAFLKPVNKKQVENYYEVIKQPMDLEKISRNVNEGKYLNRHDFVRDLDLIYLNSDKFNGPNHSVTKNAQYVVNFAKSLLDELDIPLSTLEVEIQKRLQENFESSLDTDLFSRNSFEGDEVIEETVVDDFDMYDQGQEMSIDELTSRGSKGKKRKESGELTSDDSVDSPGPSKKFRY